VVNAVLVLLLALIPASANGAPVDHTEIRPWGCRTCSVPAPTPGGGSTEDPGLGPDGDAPAPEPAEASEVDVNAAVPPALACGTSCPTVVEVLAAACAACPPLR